MLNFGIIKSVPSWPGNILALSAASHPVGHYSSLCRPSLPHYAGVVSTLSEGWEVNLQVTDTQCAKCFSVTMSRGLWGKGWVTTQRKWQQWGTWSSKPQCWHQSWGVWGQWKEGQWLHWGEGRSLRHLHSVLLFPFIFIALTKYLTRSNLGEKVLFCLTVQGAHCTITGKIWWLIGKSQW